MKEEGKRERGRKEGERGKEDRKGGMREGRERRNVVRKEVMVGGRKRKRDGVKIIQSHDLEGMKYINLWLLVSTTLFQFSPIIIWQ